MTDTSYDFLIRFFEQYLPFTPTAGQVDGFKKDLSLVSPYLMEASLVEVKNGKLGQTLSKDRDWRPAIFTVYNRKLAEHGLLFPIFHSFETAFRSTVAVTLEQHYQKADWWAEIHVALSHGLAARSVTQLCGKKVSTDTSHAIGEIVFAIDGPKLQRRTLSTVTNGFQFSECCDLTHIGRLVEVHWALLQDRFTRNGQKLGLTQFKTKFRAVRDARNDVYHHKSVARMDKVVYHAEDLLDYLDFSMQFVFDKVMDAAPQEPKFTHRIHRRHRTW